MSHTQTLHTVYAAFGRGDVPTILAQVSDTVDWNNTRVASRECPWNGDFSGKSHVAEFFKAVGENLDISVFDPHTFIEHGHHVAVLLHIELHIHKNRKPVKNDAVHVWTFDEHGKISAYRHFNDTAAELAAWRA